MPLPKRVVEPVHVARGTIPEDFPLPSELEAVTNGTLANTIRQLSSLSRHAEDLFGELAKEAHGLSDRANSLQARIDRLAVKVVQLDSNVEEGKGRLSLYPTPILFLLAPPAALRATLGLIARRQG
jgi:WAS family protein 3